MKSVSKFFFFAFFLSICIHSFGRKIIVSKEDMTLTVKDNQITLYKCSICIGKNKGHKIKKGDNKTPEGLFLVEKIQDSRNWTHDFGDGYGKRKGAYGPYFIRLKTPPFSGIGIHGTCFPESIGTRDSEGCIRILNTDISNVANLVSVGDTCLILPEKEFLLPFPVCPSFAIDCECLLERIQICFPKCQK